MWSLCWFLTAKTRGENLEAQISDLGQLVRDRPQPRTRKRLSPAPSPQKSPAKSQRHRARNTGRNSKRYPAPSRPADKPRRARAPPRISAERDPPLDNRPRSEEHEREPIASPRVSRRDLEHPRRGHEKDQREDVGNPRRHMQPRGARKAGIRNSNGASNKHRRQKDENPPRWNFRRHAKRTCLGVVTDNETLCL
jgi:hypothetical protein